MLGEHYPLLQRARTERGRTSHQGHRQRIKGGKRISTESDLGKQVDRLLAKAIVALAQTYQAVSIVLPDLAHIREVVEAEVKQRSATKVPDFVDGQKQYAKACCTQVHQWSYHRLQDAITSKARQFGLTVEVARQEHLHGISNSTFCYTGLAGFEPTTYRLGGGRSILLSYSPRYINILHCQLNLARGMTVTLGHHHRQAHPLPLIPSQSGQMTLA